MVNKVQNLILNCAELKIIELDIYVFTMTSRYDDCVAPQNGSNKLKFDYL